MDELFSELEANHFYPVLRTIERSMVPNSGSAVEKGVPLTWDTNNGTLVVYDGEGRPWIRSRKFVSPSWQREFVRKYNLKQGARVPHSNDGGTWKRRMLEENGVEI